MSKKNEIVKVKGEIIALSTESKKMITSINSKLNSIDRNMSEVAKLISKGIECDGERGFQSELARKTGLSRQLINKYKQAGDVFNAHEEFDTSKVTVSQAMLIGRIEVLNNGVLPENVAEMRVKELQNMINVLSGKGIGKKNSGEDTGEDSGEDTGEDSGEDVGEGKARYVVDAEILETLYDNLKIICTTWEPNRILNSQDKINLNTLCDMVAGMMK